MLVNTRKQLFLQLGTKNVFFWKMLHSAEKCKRGDPLGITNIHSVASFKKLSKGDPLKTLECSLKKRHTAPKKLKAGSFSLVRFCRLR